MAYTKKAINDKYDKLRAQLKAGTIDQKTFKASANRLYELYHSDANKATRNATPAKPKPKTKPQATTTTTTTTKPKKGKTPSTDSNIMSSSSVYTGDNLKKPVRKKQGPRAGSRAAVTVKPKKRVKPKAPNRHQRRRRGM